MRILGKWGMAATLVCCGLLFLACANNDNNAPDTSVLDLWQAGKAVTTETALLSELNSHLSPCSQQRL